MTSGLLLAAVLATGCSGASSEVASGGPEEPGGEATAPPSSPPASTAETPAPPPDDGEEPTPPGTPPAAGGTLRIMSYNIKTGSESSLAAVAAAIAEEKPDIVGLQEVDEQTARSGNVKQTDCLATLAGFPHKYYGANFAFDGGTYGLAILSKFPLTATRVIRMDAHTVRANGYEPRIAVAADVTAFGKDLTFVTMHASLHAEERGGNAQKVLAALGPGPSRRSSWAT